MKKALITGIAGQDGSYLAEFLLEKGYEVHGIKRRASHFNTQRIDHIYEDPHAQDKRFVLHYGDLSDSSTLTRILQQVKPDEVYNSSAKSHMVAGSQRHVLLAKRLHTLRGFAILLVVAFGLSTVAGPSMAELTTGQVSVDHSVLCKTDWMYRGEMGLSTHYFPLTVDSKEKIANDFQVQTVANQAAEAGASWFAFTVQHQNWLMMAPNETFDRIVGNSDYTPDRDIPLDLYRALNEKNIKLVLYVNLFMNANPAVTKAMGGWPPNDILIDNMAAVYREYSLRYGNKISAWWVDGAGMGQYKNSPNRERWFTTIANALRAGNPNALVAISPALEVGRYTINSDFTAGESNDLKPVPTGRWLDGAQWHLWTYLGGWWSSGGTRFSDQELGNYASLVSARGGALTFEVGTLGVNREGQAGRPVSTPHVGYIDPAQIQQIKAIRKYLHPVASAPPVNCGN